MPLLRPGSVWLGLRSLLWAFLLPGLLAGYVPWRYFSLRDARFDRGDPMFWTGLILLLAGVVLTSIPPVRP